MNKKIYKGKFRINKIDFYSRNFWKLFNIKKETEVVAFIEDDKFFELVINGKLEFGFNSILECEYENHVSDVVIILKVLNLDELRRIKK